ncbi:hypothetical protein BMS3Abin07_00838 [bacterium BMS3Abin07]|nr:hypothetical protein BMS3Abin07_00838 [bacterium BMS3Abin07]GBE33029.1 hypothetical protein BMS3Bbin05_01961 [bacterium BMS3Bbin05]HDL20746.1 ATP-dependent sacrificial sulfur transferase LarE [Nitrospirota bacterium]HDO22653.1 ATP-dependent sacrificial sulfur transferase LarE [Nitrospirota bacterium]HDZ88276.1 ATP-dependent sacrificial sulfur transferase LarE [Nitrospirota bacterium]
MPDKNLKALIKYLKTLDNSIIAYSGGVDSSFLVRAAQMSGIRFLAVTSMSETMPRQDLENSKMITARFGIPHRVIRTYELTDSNFAENPPDRCFYCKDNLFRRLEKIAGADDYDHILDGSNTDDTNDFRPGLRANKKHGIISPLVITGMNKEDIRNLSRTLGLPTWDRPSSPCLSSRFPYGIEITPSGLEMVSRAEDYLMSLGFRIVRVRTSGATATIEVGVAEIGPLLTESIRSKVIREFKNIGYRDILIDLEGYRSGNLNRSINH